MPLPSPLTWPALAVLLALVAAGCAGSRPEARGQGRGSTTTASAAAPLVPETSTSQAPQPAFVVAAGDIASCDTRGDERTAAVVAALPGTVLTLGDNVYERGTADEFARCYDSTWGRFRERTRPSPGNHDYGTGRADAYFAYFGVQPWYSFDLGAWHLVSLNSNCAAVGGCGPGSPQERWLRADLARASARCTLAYWHHPRFSSGLHGGTESVAALWDALAEAGADVVLAGHDHHYERFALIGGVRSFVVGTGGRSLYPVRAPAPGSEVRSDRAFGVLALTLHPDRYEWRFVPVQEGAFADAGADRCR